MFFKEIPLWLVHQVEKDNSGVLIPRVVLV